MSTRLEPSELKHEAEIVWLEDVTQHRYVREKLDGFCHTRQGRPRVSANERLVGYAVLAGDAPSWYRRCFYRRVFVVRLPTTDHTGARHPGDPYPGCGAPCEGVDPLTVKPGVPGEQNDRAWGRRSDQ